MKMKLIAGVAASLALMCAVPAQAQQAVRIGAIYRDGVVIRPDGSTKIKARDRVVLFASADAVRDVEQLFRVSIQYF